MTRRNPHRYTCPGCGDEVVAAAGHHARQRNLCRACVRRKNGWTCPACGSDDPHHPTPCTVT